MAVYIVRRVLQAVPLLLGVSLVLLLQPRISFRVEQGFAALTDS